jgi:hypothetical protein
MRQPVLFFALFGTALGVASEVALAEIITCDEPSNGLDATGPQSGNRHAVCSRACAVGFRRLILMAPEGWWKRPVCGRLALKEQGTGVGWAAMFVTASLFRRIVPVVCRFIVDSWTSGLICERTGGRPGGEEDGAC